MRQSHCVSSPDETLRRELKIRRAAEEFLADFEKFHLCQMLEITSKKKMILDGEIKDEKRAVFHLISKHSLNTLTFPLYFL